MLKKIGDALWKSLLLGLAWMPGLALAAAIGVNSDAVMAAEERTGMGVYLLYLSLAAVMAMHVAFVQAGYGAERGRGFGSKPAVKAVVFVVGVAAAGYLLSLGSTVSTQMVIGIMGSAILLMPLLRVWLGPATPESTKA